MLYRPLKFLFVFALGLLIVPTMTIPPEGAFRDGAFSTVFLLWFFLGPLAVFLASRTSEPASIPVPPEKQATRTAPNLKSERSPIPVFALNGKNRFCFADAVATAFLGWITLSLISMVARDGGNWRYAINSFSLYFFLVYFYYLIRMSRAILSPVLLLSLFAAVAVMGLTESFSALYAYTIRDPAFRQSWLDDPNEIMRNSGLFYPEGSPERILLENRILGSSEPLGTYGLANTLAGVLIPILVSLSGLICVLVLSGVRRRNDNSQAENAMNPPDDQAKSRKNFLALLSLSILTFLPLFLVLILTKSRTGILAFLFGCFLFILGLIVRHWVLDRDVRLSPADDSATQPLAELLLSKPLKTGKLSSLLGFGIAVAVVVCVSILLAFQLNIIDREVFTEAGKSLGYRLDYWRSSSAMIADYPLLGIGPGCFQTRYPSYMLPQASEVIADPHNFVFELGALFGLPALILFLFFFVLSCPIPFFSSLNRNGWFAVTCPELPVSKEETETKRSSRKIHARQRQSDTSNNRINMAKGNATHAIAPETETKFFFAGLGIGLLFAFVLSFFTAAPFDMSFPVCGLVAFLLVVPLFGSQLAGMCQRWAQNPLSARFVLRTVLLCVCGTILLNCCAAGGFSYPPVAMPLWLCLAVLVNDSLPHSEKKSQVKKQNTQIPTLAIWSVPLGLIIPLLFYFVVFLPAIRGESLARKYRIGLIQEDQNQLELLTAYPRTMEKADKYSIPLAQIYFEIAASTYAQISNYRTHNLWQQTRQHLLEISPLNSSIYDVIGSKELDLSKQFKTDKLLPSACDILTKAVRLAPYDARKNALLAIALETSGKHDDALLWGAKAIQLDKSTPHLDRKLTTSLREEIEKIVATPQEQKTSDDQ